ncbi:hypothetical protein Tsp_07627 [Trichinella spiralis]|uniref:hypothetical protein n=1 Tax=Trichinella spiralis TaxID=6334 RepID=UPI0001EFC224|nr:hypothetical protein Tsp_07627 [Trichinella spiralis]
MVSAENEISSSNFEKRFNALIAYMKSIRLMKTLWEQFNMQIQFWERQMEVIFNTNECHIHAAKCREYTQALCKFKTCDELKQRALEDPICFTSQCDGTVVILGVQCCSTLVTSPVWEECKGNDCESALPGTTDSRAIFSLLTALHDAVGKLKSTLLDLGALTTLRKHV